MSAPTPACTRGWSLNASLIASIAPLRSFQCSCFRFASVAPGSTPIRSTRGNIESSAALAAAEAAEAEGSAPAPAPSFALVPLAATAAPAPPLAAPRAPPPLATTACLKRLVGGSGACGAASSLADSSSNSLRIRSGSSFLTIGVLNTDGPSATRRHMSSSLHATRTPLSRLASALAAPAAKRSGSVASTGGVPNASTAALAHCNASRSVFGLAWASEASRSFSSTQVGPHASLSA